MALFMVDGVRAHEPIAAVSGGFGRSHHSVFDGCHKC